MSQLNLRGLSGSEGRDPQKLASYLYQLTEQLRYVLGNLEPENFGAETIREIQQVANQQADMVVKDQMGNYASVKRTAEMIASEVGAVDGRVSQVEQTAQGLTTRVQSAERTISQVEQTASGIVARVESAERDISQVEQTATALSSRVSSAEGNASYALQTASGLSVRVSTAEGNITRIDQTIEGLSVTNKMQSGSYSATLTGGELDFSYNGTTRSALSFEGEAFDITAVSGPLRLFSGTGITLTGGAATLGLGTSSFQTVGGSWVSGPELTLGGSIIPDDNEAYHLGGYGKRFKHIFNSETSIRTGSDRALKKDIAGLDALPLLRALKPVRYVLKSDELEQLRFGFIAQEVRETIQGTGYENAAFFDGGGGEGNLGLMYGELIAVLVEGWQEHEREIARQQARIDALEARICRLEGDSR